MRQSRSKLASKVSSSLPPLVLSSIPTAGVTQCSLDFGII